MSIRKEAKNKHFRKLLPKQVIKVTLRSSNSPNKNGRSGCHKLINKINQQSGNNSGFTAGQAGFP